MKIIIQGEQFGLFESLAGSTLKTLDDVAAITKARGFEITAGRVRSYLTDDLFKNTEPFGYVNTVEKRLAFQSLIFIVWRAAGNSTQTFDDAAEVALSDVQIQIDEEDIHSDPKDPTVSAQGVEGEPAS